MSTLKSKHIMLPVMICRLSEMIQNHILLQLLKLSMADSKTCHVWVIVDNSNVDGAFKSRESARKRFLEHRVKQYFTLHPEDVKDWKSLNDPSSSELELLLDYFDCQIVKVELLE